MRFLSASLTAACQASCTAPSQQGSDIGTASRSNRTLRPLFTNRATVTRSVAMTGLEPRKEPEDPNELRSAAVDALRDAARQSDPREFNRLTRHALALIERARAIRHDRQYTVSEAPDVQVLHRDQQVNPRSPNRIIEFLAGLWHRLRRPRH